MSLMSGLFPKLFGSSSSSRSPEIPDNVTTDKQLRSLRRHRRTQLEELEKERLRKEIQKHNTQRDSYLLRGKNNLASQKITIRRKNNNNGYLGKGGIL